MAELYLMTGPRGRQYVGVTSKTALERFAVHCKDSLNGKYPNNPLARAIRKYGAGAFSVRTLVIGSWEYVLEIEDSVITAFGTMTPNGYNAKQGGIGGCMSTEARKAMSESRKRLVQDPSVRAALSNSQLEVWQRPGYKDKMREAQRNAKPRSAEAEQRRKKNAAKSVGGEEYKRRQSVRMKEWWAQRKEMLSVNQ